MFPLARQSLVRATPLARTLVLATLTASAAAVYAAQAPQTPPSFRSSTQLVSVDVVVTGKDDVPVTDLKKDEFEILENGKPQRISEFAYISVPLAHRAVDIDARPRPPSDVASNGRSARASRAIVLFVDDSSLSSVMFCDGCPDVIVALKNALTRFLQSLSPDDQVAIVWQSRSDISQDFTNDLPRLIAAINHRKLGLGRTALGPQWRPTINSLKFVIAAFAGSNYGRRAIVYVGASACNPNDQVSFQGVECRDLYKSARDANVPIYAIDPRVSPPQRSDTMAELAINTGGLHFIGQSEPLAAVDKIVADNGSFYTLGFRPEPLVNDGKYHELKVNVTRPGVRVRSRERYLADSPTNPASTPTRDMTKSLGAGLDDPSLPVRLWAGPLAAADRGMVRTLVTLEVTYPQQEGQDMAFDDDLRVGILALSTDGKIKASFQRPFTFKGKWTPSARGIVVINETIDLPEGPLALRAGVTSRVLGRTGTAHLPITVPDYRSSELQLSPIVLGPVGQITHADAAVGLDRARSVVPFQPTTARRFTSNDALRIYLTGTWRSPATALDVGVSISGGSTPRMRQFTAPASVAVAGSRKAVIDTVVPLADLAPGSYVLRVEARLPKGKPASREIPLEIR
jgi:VWFA-related protein